MGIKVEEIRSRAELSRFVESYWHFDGRIQSDLILLPDGTFHILVASMPFNYGAQEFPAGLYFVPIYTQPVQFFSNGSIFGIRFKAFSLQNILGKKAGQVRNIHELEAIITPTYDRKIINADRSNQSTLAGHKTALENLAFDLLNRRYGLNEQLRAQVNYILDRKGNVKISELCSEIGISRQGLHKNFIQSLGIGAKDLAMTWRLNHYFTLLSEENSLTETALDAGFFDQSHSINSFKSLWNVSPGSLRASDPQLFAYAQDTMKKRFNNFFDPET